ncbi:hypothetical protein FHW88_003373 [Mucilaginibacter sp. SG538B]|nr:hypothetical protein [Mucilaginibacter sp. SG538B]
MGTAKDAAKVSAEVVNFPGPASSAVDFPPGIMIRI